MGIIDHACLIQDQRPGLSWPEALQKATFSLTGRKKIPSGMPKTRELADLRLKSAAKKSVRAATTTASAPPEHVLRNIARVKAAELERKRTGGTLPTASFVRGGTMIKK